MSSVSKFRIYSGYWCPQEAKLSQRGCVTLHVIENFVKSLQVTRGYWKWHSLIDHQWLPIGIPQ